MAEPPPGLRRTTYTNVSNSEDRKANVVSSIGFLQERLEILWTISYLGNSVPAKTWIVNS